MGDLAYFGIGIVGIVIGRVLASKSRHQPASILLKSTPEALTGSIGHFKATNTCGTDSDVAFLVVAAEK